MIEKIEDWAIVICEDDYSNYLYTAPELIPRRIIGKIGDRIIKTSRIVSLPSSTRVITSNSEYDLGEANQEYLRQIKYQTRENDNDT